MRIWRSRGIRLTRIRYQPLPTYQPSACPIDNLIASIVDPYSGSELLCLRVSSTQPGLPPDGAFVLPEIYCEIQAPGPGLARFGLPALVLILMVQWHKGVKVDNYIK